ncbi:thioredoxin family protein [Desulfatitalea alkaliphila]|uniref:Thioredoxin family protein n=1 Tax=Desulfatitalea alkaliphila TaxID=2929485 RepID=A0AA41UJN0_9BACT|nr:thioredoxin family protein [Desulfatitalea alkaliphila]MCJ8501344.1 thioredoxin family protein [Desulfatitalea alkaliphila]
MKSRFPIGRVIIILLVAAAAVYAIVQSQSGAPSAPSASALSASAPAGQGPLQLNTGRVTMIDLGATECVPCKMMAPILEELKQEYAGRADIIFIDVWKDPPQARKYGIRAIPTQIFFDAQGNEAFRHTGFMDKQRIVDALAKLGVS